LRTSLTDDQLEARLVPWSLNYVTSRSPRHAAELRLVREQPQMVKVATYANQRVVRCACRSCASAVFRCSNRVRAVQIWGKRWHSVAGARDRRCSVARTEVVPFQMLRYGTSYSPARWITGLCALPDLQLFSAYPRRRVFPALVKPETSPATYERRVGCVQNVYLLDLLLQLRRRCVLNASTTSRRKGRRLIVLVKTLA